MSSKFSKRSQRLRDDAHSGHTTLAQKRERSRSRSRERVSSRQIAEDFHPAALQSSRIAQQRAMNDFAVMFFNGSLSGETKDVGLSAQLPDSRQSVKQSKRRSSLKKDESESGRRRGGRGRKGRRHRDEGEGRKKDIAAAYCNTVTGQCRVVAPPPSAMNQYLPSLEQLQMMQDRFALQPGCQFWNVANANYDRRPLQICLLSKAAAGVMLSRQPESRFRPLDAEYRMRREGFNGSFDKFLEARAQDVPSEFSAAMGKAIDGINSGFEKSKIRLQLGSRLFVVATDGNERLMKNDGMPYIFSWEDDEGVIRTVGVINLKESTDKDQLVRNLLYSLALYNDSKLRSATAAGLYLSAPKGIKIPSVFSQRRLTHECDLYGTMLYCQPNMKIKHGDVALYLVPKANVDMTVGDRKNGTKVSYKFNSTTFQDPVYVALHLRKGKDTYDLAFKEFRTREAIKDKTAKKSDRSKFAASIAENKDDPLQVLRTAGVADAPNADHKGPHAIVHLLQKVLESKDENDAAKRIWNALLDKAYDSGVDERQLERGHLKAAVVVDEKAKDDEKAAVAAAVAPGNFI